MKPLEIKVFVFFILVFILSILISIKIEKLKLEEIEQIKNSLNKALTIEADISKDDYDHGKKPWANPLSMIW